LLTRVATFCQRYTHHRALPSFPTRRSSDLRREKLAIARQHLIPKQLEEHGLKPEQLTITDEAVEEIIEHYTREAGVRNLERTIRSEEHTSELQSREKLVCRLLLEKKNATKT